MPITKKQSDVPGVSEDVAALQAENDDLRKRVKELEAELAGKIPQVSSGPLQNYPEAEYEKAHSEPEQEKTDQPRTGASAIASEK